ncbi:MAG: cytosine permease, partial [Bacillota bacterium]
MSDWTKDVSNPELLPIPEDHRKSTPVAQFWIWFSAQVAVVTWAAGTLPIVLGLGLKESLFAIIVGNIIGCLLFAAIGVIGKGTGVNQMVVGRMPFGRVGNNLACLMNALMEIGWPSVLTYFSVTALVAIAGLFGIEIGTAGKVILALLTVG